MGARGMGAPSVSLCVFLLTPAQSTDPKKCSDADTLKDQYFGQNVSGEVKKQRRKTHFLAELLE